MANKANKNDEVMKPIINGPFSSVSSSQREAINNLSLKIKTGVYILKNLDCLCNSVSGYTIAEKDRYGLDFSTLLCSCCGLMRTTPFFTFDSIIQYYNQDYRLIFTSSKKGIEKHFQNQFRRGLEMNQYIHDQIKIDSNFRVYDVGCATGGTLAAFKNSGAMVKGIEPNEMYAQFARCKGIDVVSNPNVFYTSETKADLIILSHVLEHLINPVVELKRIRMLLKETGKLYVETPGIFNTHNSYSNFSFSLQHAHAWYFTLESLRNLVEPIGFKFLDGNENIVSFFESTTPSTVKINTNLPEQILKYLTK